MYTSRILSFLLYFVTVLLTGLASSNPTSFRKPVANMATQESAVLRELKETIQKQAAELEALKKKMGTKSIAPMHGGGHGAGGTESHDDLSLYLTRPFHHIARKRVGWLGLFLISLSLTALIMNGFEHTLSKQIELAYFVPLLAGHGGNTGGQAVGTVLSALSAGLVTLNDAPRVIAKEALSGMTVGLMLATIVGPVAHYVMGISLHVATVIFCTLPLVSTIAATLGSTIPFVCIALGLDPSVIAAPAMTSFVDVSGLMSYFLIANQVFSIYGVEL